MHGFLLVSLPLSFYWWVQLEVNCRRARRFYEQLGYRNVGEETYTALRVVDGKPMDDSSARGKYMRKSLKPFPANLFS